MEALQKYFVRIILVIFILGGIYFLFFYQGDSFEVSDVEFVECGGNFSLEGEKCVSLGYVEGKEISLDYFFEGDFKELDLVLYGEVYDYLLDLPREIYYSKDETPQRKDFKLLMLDDSLQREALLPLVFEIQKISPGDKINQARIAISLVQNIPYSEPNETVVLNGQNLRVSRYPYQVLFEGEGSCEGKSGLLVFLLREIGYDVGLFHYVLENHEAVGIKCPLEESLYESGYCFVETTAPSILGDSSGDYPGTGRLLSLPEIILISEGISLPSKLEEYGDSKKFARIQEKIWARGKINLYDKWVLDGLMEKYFGV
jgi:hypothetical protein